MQKNGIAMRVLITGVCGMIGSACAEVFKGLGWEVFGIDSGFRHTVLAQDAGGFVIPDAVDMFSDRNLVHNEIDLIFGMDTKFDAVIHCAGQPSHEFGTSYPSTDFKNNVAATDAAIQYAWSGSVFVHCSTNRVYPDTEGGPHQVQGYDYRNFPTAGTEIVQDTYRLHKTMAEHIAINRANRIGCRIGIFRLACVTSASQETAPGHGWISWLARCAARGERFTIDGTGSQVRDLIHAEDVARAFAEFVLKGKASSTYDLGGGPNRALSVNRAVRLLGPKFIENGPARASDHRWWVTNIEKFRADFPDWDYKWSLDQIIQELKDGF